MNTHFNRNTLGAVGLVVLAAVATDASAKFQPAMPSGCDVRVTDLTVQGKPLTYASAANVDGAYVVASNGNVRVPRVTLPNGREAAFTISRNGCARLDRVLGTR